MNGCAISLECVLDVYNERISPASFDKLAWVFLVDDLGNLLDTIGRDFRFADLDVVLEWVSLTT